MVARWVGFLVWVAAGASLVFWALRWLAPGMPAPPQAKVVALPETLRADYRPMLGVVQAAPVAAAEAVAAQPVSPGEAPRLTLVGVVAPPLGGSSREALALIALDDHPPRAYRVGHRVGEELVLQSVSARVVRLGSRVGGPAVELEVPVLPVAVPTSPAGMPGGRSLTPTARPVPGLPGGGNLPAETPAAPAPGSPPRTP